MPNRSAYAGVSWTAPDAYGVQWTCGICDGAEECAPGYEPPSPPVCSTCARLCLLDALSALGVAL
ncbi:hypothetical protein ACIBH1_47225 [Nonomuraea sp. NPDC050663]|uniref:hypothetical protein n=1 Tax=Nonomuraea sp. NPDC050663 TaxID=3364370 RepID=UPI0037979E5F